MDQEPAVIGRQRLVDARDVVDDLRAEPDILQMGDGIGGHGSLLHEAAGGPSVAGDHGVGSA